MLARRLAFVALLATCVCAGAASASDGGSGTYTATGSTYYFVFFNDGTTAWQYFYLVGPPGTRFVGGGTISEASPRCAVGEPEARPDEIECGPLTAPVACGSPFQLYVSSTGAAPFTRVGDAVFAGGCAATRLHALTPPAIQGTAVVGHTLRATPPVWSATPGRVSYRWQRCSKQACSSIRGARTLSLALTRPDRGRAVRLVATATLGGATVASRSGKLVVR